MLLRHNFNFERAWAYMYMLQTFVLASPSTPMYVERVVVGFEERIHLLDEGERLISLPVVIKEGELTQKVTLIVTTEDRTATGKE